MVIVAVLLLPVLGLLLFTMTYLEDRLLGDPEPPRHARRRAIDLIDEAGSRMRIRRLTAPPDLREFD
ncbi:hypothetical protein ACFVZK_33080, partial [Streptomyces rochei]|uniref:hypothetical protein n=1 Tax=Streptomyces rochei TaxID=1928 RepID=UPI0036E725B1